MTTRTAGWAVLLLGTAAAVGLADDPGPSARVKEKLGDKTLAILQGADRVEAFRIKPSGEAKPDDKQIGGYIVTATGAEQKKDFAKRLAGVLQQDKTYFGDSAKCFLPGVAFRLWKDKESVDVIVCFSCTNLRVTARDADGKELTKASGGFGQDKGDLLKLAKEAFPDDKEIQAIGEEKKE